MCLLFSYFKVNDFRTDYPAHCPGLHHCSCGNSPHLHIHHRGLVSLLKHRLLDHFRHHIHHHLQLQFHPYCGVISEMVPVIVVTYELFSWLCLSLLIFRPTFLPLIFLLILCDLSFTMDPVSLLCCLHGSRGFTSSTMVYLYDKSTLYPLYSIIS